MMFRRIRSTLKKSLRKFIPVKKSSPAVVIKRASEPVSIPVSEQLTVPPASPSAATLKPPLFVKSSPVVEPPLNQDKRFKKTAIGELMAFKRTAEHLGTGAAGVADGWWHWIGLGGLSVGIAVLNAGVALLSAFGILLAPISAGIALGVSLAGIVGAIGLNIYLNRRRCHQFARADKLMDHENIESEMSKIADALTVVLHDQLQHCTRNEAEMLAKAACEVISKAMLDGKITSLDMLQSPASLSLILAKYASYAPQYKFQARSAENKTKNTRDILKGLVKVEPVVVNVKRVAPDVPSTAAEREPLLAAVSVSGQSMFAKTNVVQSRRFAPVPPTTPNPRRMV